jgi:CheY-like chemotaxis protein
MDTDSLVKEFNILLLDDSKVFLQSLEVCINGNFNHGVQKINCSLVTNGPDAFGHLLSNGARKTKYDMIFTDLKMPIMSGEEFIRISRRHPALKNIPMVIITGSENTEEVEALAKTYRCDAMSKNISSCQLAAVLSDTLGVKQTASHRCK